MEKIPKLKTPSDPSVDLKKVELFWVYRPKTETHVGPINQYIGPEF